jgi:DNA-binding LacI/PurR family transcriptional regulator
MATTIRQVAAAAGVSVATASRALSGSDAVVQATRERVLRVASDLDYTPSRLGRSLATGSTGNIGVILPDVTNPFYTSFLAELETAAGARDIGVLVGDSHETPDLERRLIQRMTSQVDALVLASSRLGDDEVAAASARLPVVLANRMLGAGTEIPERLSQITIDVRPGFRQVVEHLHALGHRAITYVDGPPQSWSGGRKRAVLRRECVLLGMRLTVVPASRPDFDGGREAGGALAGVAPLPTAIVAFNDQMALGILSALRDAGHDVPGCVSVVGCDDSLPVGMAWPALTTVDSSSRTLGALTAAAILDPDATRSRAVSTQLIVRDSTGAVRAGGERDTDPRSLQLQETS